MKFQYYIPVKILFGKGQLTLLHKQKLPGKKALLVISAGTSAKKFGYLARVEEELQKAGVEHVLYDQILPNPILTHVMEGAALARENECDFVIGLGGGSSIDAAKAIAIMATNDGDYWDYMMSGSGKKLPIQNDPLPIVAITTTAGTGTEADPWTVTTHQDRNEKIGFGTEKTFPVLSIVDPDLMMSIPWYLTAYQGFDALFHSTEGYLCRRANVMSDLYSLKAISLLAKYLPIAVKDGQNEEARAQVALANTLSGMVESLSSCTAEHAMEHALSAYHPSLPHGAGLIMLSEAYYTYYAKNNIVPDRMIEMAKAMGASDPTDPIAFVSALKKLQEDCLVADLHLTEYGGRPDMAETYAKNAYDTMGHLFKADPVEIPFEDTVAIFQKSFR